MPTTNPKESTPLLLPSSSTPSNLDGDGVILSKCWNRNCKNGNNDDISNAKNKTSDNSVPCTSWIQLISFFVASVKGYVKLLRRRIPRGRRRWQVLARADVADAAAVLLAQLVHRAGAGGCDLDAAAAGVHPHWHDHRDVHIRCRGF